jgi:ADP-ribose pyrophosphatase
MSIKTLASRIVYQNRWMTVREDAIERGDGSPGIYAVVEKPQAALIIPIEDGHLYLIEQFRYPVRGRFLEFPAGTWELNPEADPLELARGELMEETGLRAGKMEYIGHLFYAYGITNQGFHIYRATELSPGEQSREQEEQDLLVKRIPIVEFESLIYGGIIQDSSTVAAWALSKAKQPLADPATSL